MIRAHGRLAGAAGADLTARLTFDDRHRRRLAVTTVEGERVLLDLPEAARLRGGDRLALEDGRVLAIEAEAEAVADLFAPGAEGLTRLAWHLGNRHTPTAILGDRLRIRRDHVLEDMVERLGGRVEPARAPFDPEVGAYHDGHGHSHGAEDGGHGPAQGEGDGHAHGGPQHHDHGHWAETRPNDASLGTGRHG